MLPYHYVTGSAAAALSRDRLLLVVVHEHPAIPRPDLRTIVTDDKYVRQEGASRAADMLVRNGVGRPQFNLDVL